MSTYNIIYQVDACGTQVARSIEADSEAGALQAAAQRIAELEEALEPFSKIIIEAGAIQEVYIRTSDILAARAALRAPKEEHPIAREADENRRRRQKEFEAIVALRALHDPGAR